MRVLLLPCALSVLGLACGPAAPPPLAQRQPVDVVVVGAGPAGLAATVAAQDEGAEVVLLEMDERVGGTGRWAGGMVLAAGSWLQQREGIEDGPEDLLAEWPSITGAPPSEWSHEYAWASAGVIDWITDLGVEWDGVQLGLDGGTVPRLHQIRGARQDVIDAVTGASPSFVQAVDLAIGRDPRRRGGAHLVEVLASHLHDPPYLSTEVTSLIWEEGRVAGVRYRSGEDEGELRAGAVVLATGGFMRDLQRVRDAVPGLEGIPLSVATGPHSTGRGLDLAAAVGARPIRLDHPGLYLAGFPHPGDDADPPREILLTPKAAGVVLDGAGRRLGDESRLDSLSVVWGLLERPDPAAWLLLDARGIERLHLVDVLGLPGQGDLSRRWLRHSDQVLRGHDLDELLLLAGLPGDAVRESLAPLDELAGPFTLIRLTPAAAKSFGGLATDLSCRVLDADRQPIDGLYAAGEVAGMAGGDVGGRWGFDGSLGACLYSGRVAGREGSR